MADAGWTDLKVCPYEVALDANRPPEVGGLCGFVAIRGWKAAATDAVG